MPEVAAAPQGRAALRHVERRLVGQALSLWERLRGERRFPTCDETLPRAGRAFGANVFLVKAGRRHQDFVVVSAGEAVTAALGGDAVGRTAAEILPSSVERGLSFYMTAAQMQKPIADVGRFTNRDGREVRYRSVLMPLGDGDGTVHYLLGAFSCKVMQ